MASHTPSSRAIGVPAVACSLFAVSGVRQLSFSKSEGDCQVVSGSRRGAPLSFVGYKDRGVELAWGLRCTSIALRASSSLILTRRSVVANG
eukprot:scaffold139840_cov36-Tisochrysis_lutea.AAC.3